jgi:hypothetical protein
MRTTVVAIAVGFVALALGPPAHAQKPRQEQEFCAAVDTFRAASEPLRVVGPRSGVAEARVAVGNVIAAANAMERTTNRPNSPSVEQLHDAVLQLQRDVTATPGEGTLGHAAEPIRTDTSAARDYAHQVTLETGCPFGESPDVLPAR